MLGSLPDELTRLKNLRELLMVGNNFTEPPLSVLSRMTGLNTINLARNCCLWRVGDAVFKVPVPLTPILHPGLILLDLLHDSGFGDPFIWDPISLLHIKSARLELSERNPPSTLLFERYSTAPFSVGRLLHTASDFVQVVVAPRCHPGPLGL